MKNADDFPFVRAGAALGLALFAGACGEPLSQVELIDKTRVIGARVEVGGDPTRAAPLPGESVSVRILVVDPEPDPALSFSMAACVARDSRTDLASCAGSTLATAVSLDPVPGLPTIDFVAPADASGEERLLVLGWVCPSGVALSEAAQQRCADGRDALAFSLDFSLDDGGHPNGNPSLKSVTLDGVDFPADTATTTDCALLPAVPRGSPHTLRVELDPSSRDPLPEESAVGHSRESLLVSTFVTSGELDHAYGAIESSAPHAAASTIWTAPASVGAEPRLARLFVVVRDGRGGSEFFERRVCVTP